MHDSTGYDATLVVSFSISCIAYTLISFLLLKCHAIVNGCLNRGGAGVAVQRDGPSHLVADVRSSSTSLHHSHYSLPTPSIMDRVQAFGKTFR